MSIFKIQSIFADFLYSSLDEDIPALKNIISYNIYDKIYKWFLNWQNRRDNLLKNLDNYNVLDKFPVNNLLSSRQLLCKYLKADVNNSVLSNRLYNEIGIEEGKILSNTISNTIKDYFNIINSFPNNNANSIETEANNLFTKLSQKAFTFYKIILTNYININFSSLKKLIINYNNEHANQHIDNYENLINDFINENNPVDNEQYLYEQINKLRTHEIFLYNFICKNNFIHITKFGDIIKIKEYLDLINKCDNIDELNVFFNSIDWVQAINWLESYNIQLIKLSTSVIIQSKKTFPRINYLKEFKTKELPSFKNIINYNLGEQSEIWLNNFMTAINNLQILIENEAQENEAQENEAQENEAFKRNNIFNEYKAVFYKIILDDSFNKIYGLLYEKLGEETINALLLSNIDNKDFVWIKNIEKSQDEKSIELIKLFKNIIYTIAAKALLPKNELQVILNIENNITQESAEVREEEVDDDGADDDGADDDGADDDGADDDGADDTNKTKEINIEVVKLNHPWSRLNYSFEEGLEAIDELWFYLISLTKNRIPRLLTFRRSGGSLLTNKIAGDSLAKNSSWLTELLHNIHKKRNERMIIPLATTERQDTETGTISLNKIQELNSIEEQVNSTTYLYDLCACQWAYFEMLEMCMAKISRKQYECWLLQEGYVRFLNSRERMVSAEDASAIIACLTRDTNWQDLQNDDKVWAYKNFWCLWDSMFSHDSTQHKNFIQRKNSSIRPIISGHLNNAKSNIRKINSLIYEQIQKLGGNHSIFAQILFKYIDENYIGENNDRLTRTFNDIANKDLQQPISLLRLMSFSATNEETKRYMEETHKCCINDSDDKHIFQCCNVNMNPERYLIQSDAPEGLPEGCRFCHYACTLLAQKRKDLLFYKIIYDYFTQSKIFDEISTNYFLCQDIFDLIHLPDIPNYSDVPRLSISTKIALEIYRIKEARERIINKRNRLLNINNNH